MKKKKPTRTTRKKKIKASEFDRLFDEGKDITPRLVRKGLKEAKRHQLKKSDENYSKYVKDYK